MNSADEGSSSNKSNGTPSTSARVKSCGSAENPYTAVTRRSAPIGTDQQRQALGGADHGLETRLLRRPGAGAASLGGDVPQHQRGNRHRTNAQQSRIQREHQPPAIGQRHLRHDVQRSAGGSALQPRPESRPAPAHMARGGKAEKGRQMLPGQFARAEKAVRRGVGDQRLAASADPERGNGQMIEGRPPERRLDRGLPQGSDGRCPRSIVCGTRHTARPDGDGRLPRKVIVPPGHDARSLHWQG